MKWVREGAVNASLLFVSVHVFDAMDVHALELVMTVDYDITLSWSCTEDDIY